VVTYHERYFVAFYFALYTLSLHFYSFTFYMRLVEQALFCASVYQNLNELASKFDIINLRKFLVQIFL